MNFPNRLAAATFLLLIFFADNAAFAALVAQNDAIETRVVSIGKDDKLADVLKQLLAMTNSRVYLLGPVDMQAGVDSMMGRPRDVLEAVLKKYSYVATSVTAGTAPGVTVHFSSEPVEEGLAFAETRDARADAGSSSQNGRIKSVHLARRQVVNGESTASALSEQSLADNSETTAESSGGVAQDGTNKPVATAAETAAEKQSLDVKIKSLESYIKSGSAEDQYNYWAKIKEPKYIYNPWQELDQLKNKYSQL